MHFQCVCMLKYPGDQLALGVAREKKVRPKPSYRESSLYATRSGSRNMFASGNGTLSQNRRPFSGTPAHKRPILAGVRGVQVLWIRWRIGNYGYENSKTL